MYLNIFGIDYFNVPRIIIKHTIKSYLRHILDTKDNKKF
jgi:hypothetical protein